MEPIDEREAVSAPREVWKDWSLFRMVVIMTARPTTTPARRGARNVMFDFMSEIISARRSFSLWFILSMFFMYSEMDMSERAATWRPFFTDSTRILMEVAINCEG